MKRCCTCKQEFPPTTEYFHRDKRRNDGLFPACKTCACAAKRKDYSKHKEKRLEYLREYYRVNGEYVRERKRRYDAEHRELVNERARIWSRDNADEINRRRRELHAANPTPKRESDRRYYKKARHKIREKQIRWEHENPHKKQAIGHRYSARKRELPHDFTGEDWQRALNYFGGCCAYCGTPPGLWNRLTAEHFIPVTKGGGTIPMNIIPACQSCNSSKHDSYIDDWLPRKFGKRRAARIMAVIQSYFESLR